MTLAILATALLSLCTVAALLYAMQMRIENDRLRAAVAYYIELIKDLMLEDE